MLDMSTGPTIETYIHLGLRIDCSPVGYRGGEAEGSWPSTWILGHIVDVGIQEAANKGRHWRIVMGDHIEVQVFGRLNEVLLWEPLLEGSQVVI